MSMKRYSNWLLDHLYHQLKASTHKYSEIEDAIDAERFVPKAMDLTIEETENYQGWDSGLEFQMLHKEAELICKEFGCRQWRLVKDILLIEGGFEDAVKHYRNVKE